MAHDGIVAHATHRTSAAQQRIQPGQECLHVVQNEEVAQDIFQMTLEGDLVSRMVQPGQFVHVKCASDSLSLLRRPISICDVRLAKRQLLIIYRVEGEGTKQLAQKKPGQTVDVLGPLGKGFPTDFLKQDDQAILVGGGVGVPPLYYLAKELHRQGIRVTHVLGFQSKKDVFLYDEFSSLGDTYVTTVDGTLGTKGLVTRVLDRWPVNAHQAVYACGPQPMLQALSTRYKSSSVPANSSIDVNKPGPQVYLSLEQRMGCGIGACFACVCHTPNSATGYKKVCADGPVFRLGEVML